MIYRAHSVCALIVPDAVLLCYFKIGFYKPHSGNPSETYDEPRLDKLYLVTQISDAQILLHGNSMGSATVCMMSGLELPPQVKGIISDCAFTSMKEVFTHVLHSMYHIPAFPMLQIADWANKRQVGYGLDDLSSAREVRKAKVPFLFIHGEDDVFVPCWMTEEIYKNCASPKTKLIVKGAGHGESYYKDTEGYERAMDSFIGGIIK